MPLAVTEAIFLLLGFAFIGAMVAVYGHLKPRRKIPNYSGNGTMHVTDTRCAWCDWIDALSRDGIISEALAQRATL